MLKGRSLLLLGAALAGLAVNIGIAILNSETWDVDFNQYYSAGQLVGHGDLYNWNAVRPLELQRNRKAVPFGRIPAFAVAVAPLTALPYPVARGIWLGLSVGALIAFTCLWPFEKRNWVLPAVCWSSPAAMCLALGQDSVFFLLFVTVGVWLLRRGDSLVAGLVFSLCLAKPHLSLLIPVFFIARQNWRAFLGGVLGVAASLTVSFAAEGRDWVHKLLTLAAIPDFDPAGFRMPNLRGLLTFAGGSLSVEVVLALGVVTAFWFIAKSQPLTISGAVLLAAGLAISHHAYFYDALLLLPALLLPFQYAEMKRLRVWALILFTPAAYTFLLTNLGLLGHLAISGYTIALLALLTAAGTAYWRRLT